MRLRALGLAGVLLTASGQQTAWTTLEIWVSAIESHEAGTQDAAVLAMFDLTGADIEQALPNMAAVLTRAALLLPAHEPSASDPLFQEAMSNRSWSPAEGEILKAYAERVVARGYSRFLKRAAMLHTDIVIGRPDAHLTAREGQGHLTHDGQTLGDEGRPWHWMLGRAFLHPLPRARQDADVRLWYQAAANYLWSTRNFTEALPHLHRAVEIFPDDAEVQFMAGVVHEAQGAPHLQAAVESHRDALPPRQRASYVPSVKPAGAENATARAAFLKAVSIDPAHVEARIRLGRALWLDRKYERAAAELKTAASQVAGGDARLRYFAQLFLGRAEESLNRVDEARAAYERAAALFPAAQSPRLALSRLEMQQGNRDAAGAHLAILAQPREGDADPWWTYHFERVPDRRDWMARLTAAFRKVAQ
ncbi:MAG TPA: tetratricopeptide repeat protein [Vicinamibacterales bacterium]